MTTATAPATAKTSASLASVGLLIARIPIAVYFILAGWMKVSSIGVGKFVQESAASVPHFIPPVLGHAYLYALPWTEMLMGTLLLLGLAGRFAALIMSLILISIIIAVTGPVAKPGALMLHQNIVFLGLTIGLMLAGTGRISLDPYVLRPRKRK
jgi:uncharacterized membrane protein YphA (DoxX/SURF4 family)